MMEICQKISYSFNFDFLTLKINQFAKRFMLINLKLKLDIFRDQFVDSILSCGLLIFLSPIWLDEIYNTIREIDVFGFGIGGSSGSLPTSGLKNVLSDLDGFGSTSRGARLLSDFRRLGTQQNSGKFNDSSKNVLEPGLFPNSDFKINFNSYFS